MSKRGRAHDVPASVTQRIGACNGPRRRAGCAGTALLVAGFTLFAGVADGATTWRGVAIAGNGSGQYCFFRPPERLPVVLVIESASADGSVVGALDVAGRAILRLAGEGPRRLGIVRPEGGSPAIYEGRLEFDPESGVARMSARLGDECRFEAVELRLFRAAAGDDAPGLAAAATRFASVLAARELALSGHVAAAARDAAATLAPEDAEHAASVRSALTRVFLAQAAIETGDVEPVPRLLADGADVLQSQLAPPHPALFYLAHIRARQRFVAGQYAESARVREQLLDWPEAAVPALHPDRLGNEIGLAAVALQIGKAEDGLARLERVLPRARSALGELHPVTIWGELNRAYALDINGRPGEASRSMLALHAQAAATYGPAHPITAQLLVFFSDFEAAAGRLHSARIAAERALAVYDTVLGPRSLMTIAARERVAYLYEQLSRFDDALALQRDLVRDLSALVGGEHPRTLRAMQNLAVLEGGRGRHADALRAAQVVRDSFGRLYGDADPHTRWAVLTLGFAHLHAGDARTGCDLLVRLAEDTRLEAALLEVRLNALLGVAQCRIEGNAAEAALEPLRAAQAIYQQRGADDEEAMATINGMQALALLKTGDTEGARLRLEALVAQGEASRTREAPQSSGGRAMFGQQVAGRAHVAGYRDLALLYARQGRTADAIRIAELARGRDLADSLQLPPSTGGDGLPDRDRLALARLSATLLEVDAEIALAAPASIERSRLAVQRQQIAEDLALARTRGDEGQRSNGSVAGLDLDAARRRIDAGTLFVGIVSVRGSRFAYIVRRDAAPLIRMLPEAPDLDRIAAAWRAVESLPDRRLAPVWRTPDGELVIALTAPMPGAARVPVAALRGRLERALIRPLGPYLSGVRRIEFAADGVLATLPLEALELHGRPLIARYEVSYVPSLAVRDALARRPPVRHARDLVAFGAPDYRRLAPQWAGPGPLEGLRWRPLPGAADEVVAVARGFPPKQSTLFVGAAATRENFVLAHRNGLLADARFLHVAAHGFLSAEAPQWSALALGGDDGTVAYVTAAELTTFRLTSDLVVLSACETALGREVAGEAVFGLPYALTVAGARATVLTLWPVADAQTVLFMRRFYARLARETPPATALAETKREFLRHPKYSAPFYWAPFVLYGTTGRG
jgi:hypothetical protein